MNDALSIESLMLDIMSTRKIIDRLSRNLTNRQIFNESEFHIPNFSNPELGFIKTVSWLYIHYYELGKVDIKFLLPKLGVYSIDSDNKQSNHFKLVHHLRTYLQHSLDLTKPRNQEMEQYCGSWFREVCTTSYPNSLEHWKQCLNSILVEAKDFYDSIIKCIQNIEADESIDHIVQDWNFCRDRYHPPHEFEILISKTAGDMGRDLIDSSKMCKKFYNDWNKALELLKPGYIFEVEARKLIENTLLTEMKSVMPIIGLDIMNYFGVEPGPKVGELLNIAKKLFEEKPCNREELLQRIKEHYEF
ncbi:MULTISPECIES: hypothetical protein [Bacillus]|uniref:hypothetical protein n=1 Tax=Bacillus TaxID=1386 RepID=UPI0012B8817F|nr:MULTISPECIES: hypothetical protein [Bacillus]HDX9497931.1 hypothetical protein [Bacillus thuringiensis]MBM6769115.1 hypothetical protein [Bacillus cereus]MCD9101673.1 hypothetical protein [Bacillus sp. PLB03]MDG0879811.1 hypothetical protein [Bacillus paranthracis]MDG0879831.1 hypothetical protein [Bacillus paranthracis]